MRSLKIETSHYKPIQLNKLRKNIIATIVHRHHLLEIASYFLLNNCLSYLNRNTTSVTKRKHKKTANTSYIHQQFFFQEEENDYDDYSSMTNCTVFKSVSSESFFRNISFN